MAFVVLVEKKKSPQGDGKVTIDISGLDSIQRRKKEIPARGRKVLDARNVCKLFTRRKKEIPARGRKETNKFR